MFLMRCCPFFLNNSATTEIYTLSLHDALPISLVAGLAAHVHAGRAGDRRLLPRLFAVEDGVLGLHLRSEEHTSELQSRGHLVCRLLLEKKKVRRISPFAQHTIQHRFASLSAVW